MEELETVQGSAWDLRVELDVELDDFTKTHLFMSKYATKNPPTTQKNETNIKR